MVEFALILPVFLVLLLGVVEFGWALRAYVVEQNAAREGARYWSLNASPTGGCGDITSQVTDKAPSLTGITASYQINSVATTTCSASTMNPVTVTTNYTYNFITPLGSFVTKIAGPWTITSSATMRVE